MILPTPPQDAYDFARTFLAWLPDHLRDQLKAQANDLGVTLLDLTAHFVADVEK